MIEFRILGQVDLSGHDGAQIPTITGHPKRVAILAFLAAAQRGRCRRDTLLATFWSELDHEHARASLRKALHFMRRSLGADILVSLGDEEISLNTSAFHCDATEFLIAVEEGRHADAIGWYRGDLLAGFFAPNAPEFEAWLEEARARFRRLAFDAARTLADQAARAGQSVEVGAWVRRALELGPCDEATLRHFLLLLDTANDRAAALAAYDEYVRRLQRDYDITPSVETQQLVQSIRDRTESFEPERPLDDSVASPARPLPRSLTFAAISVVALGIVLGGAKLLRSTTDTTLIAVGEIHDYTAPSDSAAIAGALGDMLSTNLARVQGLNVVSSARLYELVGQLGGSPKAATVIQAAKRAGATDLIDGAVYRQAGGGLRFDVRLVRLRGGTLRSGFSVEGKDIFALADRATSELSANLHAVGAGDGIATVTTQSVAAYKLYEQGLREYYLRGDVASAQRDFSAALREDSTFALAAYYSYVTEVALGMGPSGHLDQALRLAQRSSPRERLIITAAYKRNYGQPSALAVAETLAARYPNEPEGHFYVGERTREAGYFMRAVPHLRRVIALDSMSRRSETVLCHGCDAYTQLISTYLLADSMAAAERTAREYIKYRPRSALPLRELAWVLAYQDRFAQARAALQAAERIAPQTAVNVTFDQAALEIRAGHYPRADALVLPIMREGSARDRRDAEWFLIISLMHQGRIRAALPLVQRRDSLLNDEGVNVMMAIEAQLNLERRDYARAIRLFNSVTSHIPFPPSQKSKVARHQAFRLTNLASALFAAGDTTRLAALADSIQRMGQGSAFGRDQRIHNHVRGMLWLARKQPDKAEAAFRAGVYSWMAGFTRTNYELARLFLSEGRAREAVLVLQPAFRGSLEGSNLYIGRTDLHELIAQAYEAAGQRDSAAIHYRAVVDAWRNADPEFAARKAAAAQRLALLTTH